MNRGLNFFGSRVFLSPERNKGKKHTHTQRTTADERGENKVATDKRPARMNKRADVAKKRSWQGEKGAPQSRDACSWMNTRPLCRCGEREREREFVCVCLCVHAGDFYCSTGSRSTWYLERVCALLFHTDLTLILSGLSLCWRHQGSTSEAGQRSTEGGEK